MIFEDEAFIWWKSLNINEKINYIMVDYPMFEEFGNLTKYALMRVYDRNPQKSFEKFIKENEELL